MIAICASKERNGYPARDMRGAEVFGIGTDNQTGEAAVTIPTAASSTLSTAPTVAVHKILTGQQSLVTA